ncbi:STEAP3 [Branchiostoma lanceolatum]|uniref:STEAP3 protein n=1 Tax=Branchiostoma lanceolatum TaxID=7740 RepID=A0A8K0EYM2_BRALA|nr:STEAP3 [Branchiostoma lanceolatum]
MAANGKMSTGNEMVVLKTSEGDGPQYVKDSPRDHPIVIIGAGDYGRSFAGRLVKTGIRVVIGSRDPERRRPNVPEDVVVTSHSDAISRGKIVVLAVPRDAYSDMAELRSDLTGKIVVDVSNKERLDTEKSNAEYLSEDILDKSLVVKGFNVVSAWSLESGLAGGSKEVPICSDDKEARGEVIQLAKDMGFFPMDYGCLRAARDVEAIPLRLLPGWRFATKLMFGLLAFMSIYVLFQGPLYKYVKSGVTKDIQHFPGKGFNRVLAMLALTLLALVYFPGIIAAFRQLAYGTKYQRFPIWLDTWLKSRKQLGLLALLVASLHAIFSACLMSPEYYYHMYEKGPVIEGRQFYGMMFWRGELLIFTGGLALALMSVLGVTSTPSVQNAMNWREFVFVQSKLGFACLFVGTAHCIVYGSTGFNKMYLYVWYTPPPALLVMLLPCLLILLKLFLLSPCLNSRLMQIRRGWESKPKATPV